MGIAVPIPEPLARLADRPLLAQPLANDPAALRAVLESA